jgi:isoleucyl-tRNA synthetase
METQFLDAKIIRKLADLVAERGSNIWFELDDATLARELGFPSVQRNATTRIDVWIDSGVSHKAVCALHPELRDPPTCISKRPINIAAGFNHRS